MCVFEVCGVCVCVCVCVGGWVYLPVVCQCGVKLVCN